MLNEKLYQNGTPEEVFSMVDSLDPTLLSSLTQLAYERYSIPADVFERHLQRILIISRKKYFKIKQTFKWFSPLYFRIYYFFIKLSLVLLPKHKGGDLKTDVAFELWCLDGLSNYRFYKKIHELIREKIKVAFVVNNISKKVLKSIFTPCVFFSDFKINREVAREVLKKEKFTLPANESSIDSYFLWSAFLRQYAIYKTHSLHLNTKVFVTAGDNYLSPLRYWCMKQSGIKSIISIQNGFRTDCLDSGGAYYNEADLYEVFGNRQRSLLEKQGCRAQKWLPMGSVTTINKLENLKLNHDGPIVVIGHDFSYTIGEYNKKDFNRILEHIRRFSIEHKKQVLYKARTGTTEERANYEKYLASDWTVFDTSTDSYEAVASASVCINYLSTLGSEAIGMGKRVLTFNTYHNDIAVPPTDSYGVVLSWNYEEFNRKLMALLNSNSQDIENYFSELKKEVMRMDEDVFSVIANTCAQSTIAQ
jgi:hypothetical protein